MRANIQARCQGYRGGGGGRAWRWEGRTAARNARGSREKRRERGRKQKRRGASRGGRRREHEKRGRIGNEKTGRSVARSDYDRLVVLSLT